MFRRKTNISIFCIFTSKILCISVPYSFKNMCLNSLTFLVIKTTYSCRRRKHSIQRTVSHVLFLTMTSAEQKHIKTSHNDKKNVVASTFPTLPPSKTIATRSRFITSTFHDSKLLIEFFQIYRSGE